MTALQREKLLAPPLDTERFREEYHLFHQLPQMLLAHAELLGVAAAGAL